MILQRRPLEMDPGIGIDHLRTDGEGIDVGKRTIQRAELRVADLVTVRHRGRECAHQELRLIHTAIVGPDRIVACIDRAVQDVDLRVADLRLDGSLHHHDRRRKNHLCARRSCLIDRGTHERRCIAVRPGQGLELRAEASG